ncbi:MAG: hypothetical protein H6603_02495 [Flavobacteriales bacterium]|nr:hypothetical protein [Flavobacteriales bacterium]MCB9203822.1 hypothetical protein [Flavobacteriales bacterium]
MNYEQLPDIPKEFFNSETDSPFSNCLVCNCDLMKETVPYSIERAIRHYPEMELKSVVFEYAMCANCMAQMESELSDETKMAIMKYFGENFNYHNRPQWSVQPENEEEPEEAVQPEFNISEWISNCAVKDLPRQELYEYTLCARCIGGKLIPEVAPYMISGQAQDDLVELFSNKSLGFLDGFTDKYFTGPPELKELFKGRPILV